MDQQAPAAIAQFDDGSKFIETQLKEQKESESFVAPHRYLQDPKILPGFGITDRILESVYESVQPRNEVNFAKKLLNLDQQLLTLPPDNLPTSLDELCFTIRAVETTSLQITERVRDPFLTLHFVDLDTGIMLKTESSTFMTNDLSKPRPQTTSKNAHLKHSTSEFNLVSGRRMIASWNEQLSFSFKNRNLRRNSLLILFEIHNFYNDKQRGKSESQKLNKMCWGYLRPFNADLSHIGLSKIRLFTYKLDHDIFESGSPYPNVPLVYFDFLWHLKERYEAGYLVIDLKIDAKSINSPAKSDSANSSHSQSAQSHKELQSTAEPKKTDEEVKHERFLNSIRYCSDEGFQLPNTLFSTFKTLTFGCSALKFSPSGKYLAYATTDSRNMTVIKVFDFEANRDHCVLFSHANMVHSIRWSACDRYVITGSSDSTAKIFKIPRHNKMDHSSNITKMTKYQLLELKHSGFVYDAGFVLQTNQNDTICAPEYVVTCCADGNFRVYRISLEKRTATQVSFSKMDFGAFPNTFDFSDSLLVIGTSNGVLQRYIVQSEFGSLKLARETDIVRPEIKGDIINTVKITEDNEYAIVQTRDNCVRLVELKTGNIINRYFRSYVQKCNIHCFTSPDCKYLMSGSENGEVKVWDFVSATAVEPEWDYRIHGAVYAGDCNRRYNVVAFGGFGTNFPVALFYAQRKAESDEI